MLLYLQEVPKGYSRRPFLYALCHLSTFRDTIIPYNNKVVNCLNGVFWKFLKKL